MSKHHQSIEMEMYIRSYFGLTTRSEFIFVDADFIDGNVHFYTNFILVLFDLQRNYPESKCEVNRLLDDRPYLDDYSGDQLMNVRNDFFEKVKKLVVKYRGH